MRADKIQAERLIKTARGQLDGILKMMEDDRYCIDIANQLLATQSILRRVFREVLSAHLEVCVKDALTDGGGEEKIGELLDLLDRLAK